MAVKLTKNEQKKQKDALKQFSRRCADGIGDFKIIVAVTVVNGITIFQIRPVIAAVEFDQMDFNSGIAGHFPDFVHIGTTVGVHY